MGAYGEGEGLYGTGTIPATTGWHRSISPPKNFQPAPGPTTRPEEAYAPTGWLESVYRLPRDYRLFMPSGPRDEIGRGSLRGEELVQKLAEASMRDELLYGSKVIQRMAEAPMKAEQLY